MIPAMLGWALAGGGRAANVAAGTRYAGTTSQLCGLFPFAVASGATLAGVPLGRSLHTAEPVGLDPAHWLRTGLVSNTGVWVQGQPGIGKSSITKRLVTGLVGFGNHVESFEAEPGCGRADLFWRNHGFLHHGRIAVADQRPIGLRSGSPVPRVRD